MSTTDELNESNPTQTFTEQSEVAINREDSSVVESEFMNSDHGSVSVAQHHYSDNHQTHLHSSNRHPKKKEKQPKHDEKMPNSSPIRSLVTMFGSVHVPDDNEIAEKNNLMLCLLYDGLITCDSVIVLVLCGIPGCGKTTFARRLCAALPPNSHWDSYNQDALGSRIAVEQQSSMSLNERHSVIIDRCNFNRSQRETWLRLAEQYEADFVICLVMENYLNFELCTDRAFRRGDDGVHDGDTDWRSVCASIVKQFRYPVMQEGYSAIYHCRNPTDTDLFIGAFSEMTAAANSK